jgi:cell wall assembly regulator SMI1
MPHEIAPLLQRLERWLKKHRRGFLKGLNPGATFDELTKLDQALGGKTPPELRALLTWHNGQESGFTGKLEQDWLLMSNEQIAEAKRYLDEQSQEDASLGWVKTWVPFLDDDQGDHVCLDVSKSPAPVRDFWMGQGEQPVVAQSLAEWLEDFVGAVEADEYEEDPERGTFYRKE